MRRKDADVILSFRVPFAEAGRLRTLAAAQGCTLSRLARRAITAGLQRPATAPLSWGIATPLPGATLTLSLFGAMRPEVHTVNTWALMPTRRGAG